MRFDRGRRLGYLPARMRAGHVQASARSPLRIRSEGEGAILVELGSGIDEALNARVHRLAAALTGRLAGKVREVVPSYRSLLVLHDPLRHPRAALVREIERLAGSISPGAAPAPRRVVRVPVCYGGEHGPDLEAVAEHCRLPPAEVIRIHAQPVYRVYLLGFTPGFPYLGGLSPRLATPRLPSPRTRVAAGSVSIAGEQAGIYPVESPGGWRILGRTPLRLFDPRAAEPFLLAPGDGVRFEPVDPARYESIAREVEAGPRRPEVEGPEAAP